MKVTVLSLPWESIQCLSLKQWGVYCNWLGGDIREIGTQCYQVFHGFDQVFDLTSYLSLPGVPFIYLRGYNIRLVFLRVVLISTSHYLPDFAPLWLSIYCLGVMLMFSCVCSIVRGFSMVWVSRVTAYSYIYSLTSFLKAVVAKNNTWKIQIARNSLITGQMQSQGAPWNQTACSVFQLAHNSLPCLLM